ncbi:C-type mannose receptor 2-like [Cyprinodon tularosa]|uniref:C-type mannose receptor 2-like n=1 Tax=Cyprinodon tularosa TaxID=77115 RepID=UPI0018E20F72|nr:C-type mannose receptor 2-like [Cyprinodon tularosa]
MADMRRLLSNSAGNMTEAWIGLYDQRDGIRTWYWSLPGVEFNEANWNEGEPNDIITENCGFINTIKWGDISCNRKLFFLCYKKNKTSEKFFLIEEEKTWLEAQSYCRDKHTDLSSGLDQLNDDQLKDVLPKNKNVFIGLFRDTWRWSDGSSFSFRHWNLMFNDEKYNSGQCAMTVFDDGGRWKNEDCTAKKPFICYDDNMILIQENKTWEEALRYCRTHYRDLVTISNLDEQRSVQQETQFASSPFVWMGLHYACTLDVWFWVTDEVLIFENWASELKIDDCDMSGAMQQEGEHKWVKENVSEKFNFICSKC